MYPARTLWPIKIQYYANTKAKTQFHLALGMPNLFLNNAL
jgi:hypothetical protein